MERVSAKQLHSLNVKTTGLLAGKLRVVNGQAVSRLIADNRRAALHQVTENFNLVSFQINFEHTVHCIARNIEDEGLFE